MITEPRPAWTQQFSLPAEHDDPRVFDALVGARGSGVASALVEAAREPLGERSEGLAESILEWAAGPADFATAWDVTFGRAWLAVTAASGDPVSAAAALALRIAECGHDATWRAQVAPMRIRLGERVVGGVVSIRAEPGVVALEGEAGTTVARRDPGSGEWNVAGGAGLTSVGVGRPLYLLGADGVPGDGDGREMFADVFEGLEPLARITPEVRRDFRAGVRVLEACAPGYLGWVERVVRQLVICPREEGFRVVSGSGDTAPGVVHASHPMGTMEVAEMLVHESAHQYLYMLEWAGPLDDGSDPRRYWSPPIRRERPLSRILMAYHALANVLLFFDLVREATDEHDGYLAVNDPMIAEAVAELDGPLRGNAALTPLGRGLYEPLAERLAARG